MTQPKHAQLDLLLSISDGLSRGLDEMLRVSPTDAMHPPSCSLAIRDAVEELKWLRAEIERQRAEIERLREENKEKQAAFHATHVERDDLRATIKRMREQLKDPNVVALNMLHGKIALPSVEQIKHIYQERFLPPDKATVVSERDEALEGKP